MVRKTSIRNPVSPNNGMWIPGFVRLIPLWISPLGACRQAPHFVRLLFLNSGHRQSTPRLHFAHAPNGVQFKSERYVQSAVAPLDCRPIVVFFSPFVAGAINRCEDPPVLRQWDANPLPHRTQALMWQGFPDIASSSRHRDFHMYKINSTYPYRDS